MLAPSDASTTGEDAMVAPCAAQPAVAAIAVAAMAASMVLGRSTLFMDGPPL